MHIYLRITRFDLGNLDIHMTSIIPLPLATDPSHGRAKIAAICVKILIIVQYCRWGRQPPIASQGAQGAHHWDIPAPDLQ